MALSTYTRIFSEILDNRDQFESDPDRAITEMADSLCPVYTSEIIAEWTELPNEHSDAWQDLGVVSNDSTITSLMTLDLYLYYTDLVARAWAEVENTHVCGNVELPEGVTITHAHITGQAIAECSRCEDFRVAYWECACELVHECVEDGD
jgi:hypothetical protein